MYEHNGWKDQQNRSNPTNQTVIVVWQPVPSRLFLLLYRFFLSRTWCTDTFHLIYSSFTLMLSPTAFPPIHSPSPPGGVRFNIPAAAALGIIIVSFLRLFFQWTAFPPGTSFLHTYGFIFQSCCVRRVDVYSSLATATATATATNTIDTDTSAPPLQLIWFWSQ